MVPSSPWPPQDGAGLLSLGGALYLIGGWAPGVIPFPYTHSQVWKSVDGGGRWTRLANAPWEARHTAGWVVHQGSIYVIGGDVNSKHYQNDVWKGTPNLAGDIDWVLKNASATPLATGRTLHQVYSHDGKLWIVGGQTLDDLSAPTGPIDTPATKPGSPYYDDVWSSSDEGVTWVQVSTGNIWAPCGMIMGSVVKDGYMWLIGGGAYNTEGNPRVYKNTIYRSSDGVTWQLVNPSALFSGRQYHNVLVHKGEFVVLAGYRDANLNDCFVSPDGVNWRKMTLPPWQIRHAASAVSHNDEVLIMCAPLDETAVWAMR